LVMVGCHFVYQSRTVCGTLNRPADPVIVSEGITRPASNLTIKVGCHYYACKSLFFLGI
jgi:hypothetical protein